MNVRTRPWALASITAAVACASGVDPDRTSGFGGSMGAGSTSSDHGTMSSADAGSGTGGADSSEGSTSGEGSDGGESTGDGGPKIPLDALYVDAALKVAQCDDYDPRTRSCGAGTSVAYQDLDAAAQTTVPGDTVVVRANVYGARFVVPRSGEQGQAITFRSFPGETVVVQLPGGPFLPGIEMTDIHDVILDGIDVADVMMFGQLVRVSRVEIRNSSFIGARDSGSRGGLRFVDATDVIIRDNRFEDGNDSLFLENSTRALITGNAFVQARHTLLVLSCSSQNVIRDNTFDNVDQKATEVFDCEGIIESLYDDTVQVERMDSSRRNLWEYNRFVYTRASDSPSDYNAMQLAGQRGIVRRNLYWDNFGGGIGLQVYGGEASFVYLNRIYNNTVYANGCFGISASSSGDANYWGNRIVNNISVQNTNCGGDAGNDLVPGNTGATTMTANFTGDPAFVDAQARDLRLSPGSPAIDAGAFLAQTQGAGSGVELPVDDTGWFFDGYGIAGEVGDAIQLEGGKVVATVVAVDDEAGTLTLDRSLTWSAGQGVALAFTGAAPDAGALELR